MFLSAAGCVCVGNCVNLTKLFMLDTVTKDWNDVYFISHCSVYWNNQKDKFGCIKLKQHWYFVKYLLQVSRCQKGISLKENSSIFLPGLGSGSFTGLFWLWGCHQMLKKIKAAQASYSFPNRLQFNINRWSYEANSKSDQRLTQEWAPWISYNSISRLLQ